MLICLSEYKKHKRANNKRKVVFVPDFCLIPRKQLPFKNKTGLLACPFAAPSHPNNGQWLHAATFASGLYSCATAHDLHVIPY